MGDSTGAAKSRAPLDQNIEIKKAVEALGKNSDTQKLLSLLAACTSEKEKEKTLKEFQNQYRQKYDKEVKIERDPQTNLDIVCVKKWTAQTVDREALSTAATHIVAKLWKDPKAKVEVDEWLQKYSLDNPGGKLEWMRDYCKDTLKQDVVLSKVHTPKGDRIVASLRGELTLPSVPKAPIPTALKRDTDKTPAERKQEADKPIWSKIEDAVLDEAAELATLSSEVKDDILDGEFSEALDNVSNYVSEKSKTIATATVNTLNNAWEGAKDFTLSIGEKIGFISIPEPKVEQKKPEVVTVTDEEAQTVTFKVEVAETAPVELPSKPTLKLPKIPTDVDLEQGQALPQRLSKKKTEEEWEKLEAPAPKPSKLLAEILLEEDPAPAPLLNAKAASAPSVTLPERPLASVVEAEEHQPVSRSMRTEVTPELESSLRTLDLPIQSKSKYMDMMMTAMKTQLEEDGWDVDEEDEEKENPAPTTPKVANVFQTVVRSLSQDAPVLAAQAAAEARVHTVEETSRKVMAMVSPTITPTAESIRAAELALADLVNAKAPLIEIQKLSGLIQAANDRMKKKKAEDEVQGKRLYNV